MTDSGEDLLSEAINAAAGQGLVKANAYVVCILNQQGSLVIKVVQVNEDGSGIRLHAPQANKLVEGTAAGGVQGRGEFGTPTSPSFMRRASISLVGGGAFGAHSPAALRHGGAMLSTLSDIDEATAAAAAAAFQLGNAALNKRYGRET